MIDRCKKFSSAVSLSFLTVLFISFFALSQQAYATFSDCAIDWRFFENNPGFISDYTYQGNTISDHENTGTGDPTHGPANVPPAATDLASFGDAATNPGTETTPFFGYYNGGTSYDAANPLICSVSQTTCQTDSDCPLGESCIGSWEDDYIFFRMRIRGDPSAGGGKPDFSSYHWNILLDLDADGYKEYWVDLEGSCPNKTCGGNYDRLNILYNNDNRQDIVDPDAAGVRVDFFQAQNTEDFNAACTVPNSGYCSVTTSQSCTVDSDCPGGEICFISPGYSHTRSYAVGDGSGDYYIDIQVPMTAFDDSNGNQVLHPDDPVAFVYSTGASNNDPLQKDHMMDLNFLTLFDPITFGDIVYPNGQPVIEFTDASLNFVSFYTVGDNIYMWVTDPLADTTGGQDQVTVTVTNPRTGDDETITLTETENDSGIFTGCTTAVAPSAPACLLTRDTGPQSDNDGYLEVASGDTVYVSYTNASSQTVTDEADIVEPCEAYIQFTRANGLPSDNFEITDDPGTSDQLYVTITLPEANTDPGSAQTIQVILHGTQGNGTCSISIGTSCTIDSDCPDYATGETCDNLDKQTLTLTETGDDTGVFRNATGLETQISDGTITSEDDLWEDVDQGVVTAEFDPSSYSICTTIVSTSASLFYIAAAGRVYFTNSAGTLDVDLYTPGDEVFVKVVDENACSTPGPPDTLTVTVESSFGSCSVTDTTICTVDADCPGVETCVARSDSETLTVEETASGSFVFINSSPSVLTTATYSGGTPTLGDNVIELPDSYNITAIYNDYTDVPSGCSGDGDGDSGNDNKTDTALFNAPDIIITEVLFYPALTGSCDTTTTTKCVTDADCPGVETCITDPALAEVCQQTEYIELYNSSPLSVNATGYRVADEDLSVNYTIPSTCSTDSQKPCDADSDCPSGGTCTGDLILASGEHIIISFYDSGSNPPDVYDSGTYYLFDTTSSSYPSDFLGDGGYVLPEDRADQVSLYDSSATVRDYTGYSFNLTPSIDFYGDDSPAVSRDIWQDNSFLNVSSITSGYAIERVPVGQDTNSVDDWQQMSSVSEVCNVIILTRAVVSKFSANRDGDHVAVEWETTSEIGTVGFHLYRSSAIKGTYERVNKRLLPSLPGSLQGGKYRFIDKNALADASFTYRLVEVETRGRERSFGPYAVDRDGNVSILKQSPVNPGEYSFFKGPVTAQIYRYTDDDDTIVVTDTLEKSRPLRFVPSWKLKTFKPPKNAGMTVIADTTRSVTDETAPDPDEPIEEEPPADDFSVQTHAVTENQKNQTEQRKASQARAHELQKQWTGNRIKISVTKAGLYFLENSDIAEPLDVSAGDIKEMLSSGRLLLTNRENTVSYLPDEDLSGIYFYAKGIESIYTDEDIFWLEEGKGKEAKSFNRKNPLQLLEGQIFIDSIHFEEDHHSDITVVDEPESDYFFWDYIFGGYPGYDSKSFALQTPGAASNNALATLTVSLQGITDTNVNPDHHVIVTVNSTILGETFWNGINAHSASFEFPQELLLDGENVVEIKGLLDSGAPYSLFYINSFDLTYARRYEAHENMLEFRGDSNSVVTVTGFTDPDVLLFDISDPYMPKMLVTSTHDRGDGTFALSFSPDSSEKLYLAIAKNRALTVQNVWADVPSALSSETNKADYIIITPFELKDGASRLAGYRRGQGYTTMLVDLEDIIDEFNYGIFSPHAIQRFLSHAYAIWQKPPKYVVLAGEATFDYKDVFGTAENVVPSIMVKTFKGLAPSDNRYADADGDRVPDMAIGRLPVMTDEELRIIIDKIIAYESLTGSTDKKVLFIADDPVIGANFTLDSDGVVSLLPQGYTAEKIYLGDYPADTAHSLIIDRINGGVDIINYIGHGGRDRLADEGILLSSDVSLMANMQNLPVMLAFTCTIGQFDVPGYDSLGEALLLGNDGGAVAVWSPSGLSVNSSATALDKAFFGAMVPGGNNVLGDVIREALGQYRTTGGDLSMPDIYNLLGDPALRLR